MDLSDVNTDDLPPEQSAAMTLGMLSSGGVSPGPGFNVSMSGMTPQETKSTYPASMAGLLNDPLPERTGLTPNYSGPDTSAVGGSGIAGAASPFSQMFGQSGAHFFALTFHAPGISSLNAVTAAGDKGICQRKSSTKDLYAGNSKFPLCYWQRAPNYRLHRFIQQSVEEHIKYDPMKHYSSPLQR
nr:hypothetical protein CFP56_22467 [Quercus suber]